MDISDIILAAKQNGLYISQEELDGYGDWMQYNESKVCFKGDVVIKVKSPFKLHEGRELEKVIFMHILHNIYFPEAGYKLLGITGEDDSLQLVLEQPYICEKDYPTMEEIHDFIMSKGFVIHGDLDRDIYTNEVKLYDVGPGNIIKDKNG